MTLASELEQLRQGMSRFRRVALHIHSPASYDWGRGSEDLKDNRTALLTDPIPYLDCLDSTYDLVGITDHMQARFACDQRQRIKRCVVLPGMEISVRLQPPWNTPRIHFIVLFPETYALDQVERVLYGKDVAGADARSGTEIVEYRDIGELVQQVHDAGGIVIAAHIDSEGGGGYRAAFRAEAEGVLQLVCEDKDLDAEARKVCDSFKEHLAQAKIDAVEIHKASDAKHYRFTLGNGSFEIPTLSRNDAHTLQELAGGRCTFVKMTELSFEGLRRALRFPDTRIRHVQPPSQTSWIEGIRIRSGTGLFDNIILGFSPNLSCVIGARGAGKSAIVDGLRYLFGYNRNMGQGIGEDLKEQVLQRQKATLAGATIEVQYRTASQDSFLLVCDYQPNRDYSTWVCDGQDRDVHVADVEKDGRFPCRLFGWSEIERLGRDPNQQRALLDRILDMTAHTEARDTILSELREDRSRILALASSVERCFNDAKEFKKLKEHQQNLADIQQPEVEEMFEVLDTANDKLQDAKRWRDEIDQWFMKLKQIPASPKCSLSVDLMSPWESLGGTGLLTEVEQLSISLREAARKLADGAAELVKLMTKERDAAVADLEKKLSGRTDISDLARKRTTMKMQLSQALEEAQSYEGELAKLKDALAQRRLFVAKLRTKLKEVTAARASGVAQVSQILSAPGGPAIGIRLREQADDSQFQEWLKRSIPGGRTWQRQSRIIQAVSSKFGWVETGRVFVEVSGSINALALQGDDVSAAAEVLETFVTDVGSGCIQVRPTVLSTVLEADEHPADDLLEVTLKGLPIERLSPGQRCSALLPIILLGSSAPLVIDQPEDNLDNQLITDLLIHTLHGLKEHRQVIVVTHNPNIVVTGDAEQVVVMESKDGKCQVRRQASIDNPYVMRDVVELMEGGEEALRRRFKRYWPDKELPSFLLASK